MFERKRWMVLNIDGFKRGRLWMGKKRWGSGDGVVEKKTQKWQWLRYDSAILWSPLPTYLLFHISTRNKTNKQTNKHDCVDFRSGGQLMGAVLLTLLAIDFDLINHSLLSFPGWGRHDLLHGLDRQIVGRHRLSLQTWATSDEKERSTSVSSHTEKKEPSTERNNLFGDIFGHTNFA